MRHAGYITMPDAVDVIYLVQALFHISKKNNER